MPWRIACRPAAGHPPWPHVLLTLEFQATVDRHMALRVETYTALLRQDLLREGRRLAGPNRALPRVLPVVVYTGREHWNAPLGVRALTAPGPGGYILPGGFRPSAPASRGLDDRSLRDSRGGSYRRDKPATTGKAGHRPRRTLPGR